MSEDRQSTESLPPSAEQSDYLPANPGSAARSKSRHVAPATKAVATNATTDTPEEAKSVNGAHSQPMTVSNSTSSEVTSLTDGTGAAPYSTRSRGRNGATRPNYAEDVEMDFELTSPAPSTAKSASNSTKRSNTAFNVNGSPSAAVDSEKGPAASTRKGQAATTTNGVQASIIAKEAIPGTSTFSANAATSSASSTSSASRKRKQPPNGATGANPNGSAKRVLTNATESKHDIRLSSMMTFEHSGARLKNGKLKADDGTVLEVNGMCSKFL